MNAVIYHNPKCSNSRNALALIRQAGIEPDVVEYLRDPPSRARLAELIEAAGLRVRDAIRTKEAPYAVLGLADAGLGDEALLDAMVANPILIQRPLVQTTLGTRMARPADVVLEILPSVK
ncbi:arsenate reductase (glutaredoxin) [uncultured Stenotrophomonas sp.]|uniref:arsenate reductase (glutaredoxin) n=1 Tax=uncultured Stenotrophomonas sp. TaxID=165438 RepID=UPI0028E6E879|nr:arsenate reductase (glutaredoxin) [uncultured Stenotrophomonas sp.]